MKDFFILGCSRSGTTMLATQLNQTGLIIIPPETWWFSNIQSLGAKNINSEFVLRLVLNRIKDTLQVSENSEMMCAFEYFKSQTIFFRGSYDVLYKILSKSFKEYFNVESFGEKTPAHTTFMPELNCNYSDYKKIILLRDPRDIVYSYFTAWFDSTDNDAGLYDILKNIKVYLYNILYVAKGYIHWIKYEDLTSSPLDEIIKIKKFLNLPSENILTSSTGVLTANPTGIHKNITKPVFNNSGKYRRLSIEYQKIIETALSEEMQLLGYECEHSLIDIKNTIFNSLNDDVSLQILKAKYSKLSDNWGNQYYQRTRDLLKNLKIAHINNS